MPILSCMVIGKYNEPLFCHTEVDNAEDSLYLQMVSHSSLDIIEEKRKKYSSSAAGTSDLYLGHLLTISDYKSFGLLSNTQTKIIIISDLSTNETGLIRDTLLNLYNSYIIAIQNPFHNPQSIVQSKLFHNNVISIIQKFNNTAILSVNNSPIKK